jgi:hypothetical protein
MVTITQKKKRLVKEKLLIMMDPLQKTKRNKAHDVNNP